MRNRRSTSCCWGAFPRVSSHVTSGRAIGTALVAAWLALLPGRTAWAQEASTQPTTTTSPSAPALTTQPAETQPTSQPETMSGDRRILLNFKDASVQAVLAYLSEVAGLVILEGGRVDGRVTVMSRQPINTDEAVALLDTVLKEKGYAAIRTGRTLKIVPVAQAVRENLPVYAGNDPSKVPEADRLVTQVIPIRYADSTRLRADLAPLVGSGATLTANQASNSLILIDTQTNIRRIMQIIRALDEHMASVAEVKIYRLTYADAATTSRLITELFRQEQDQREAQRIVTPFGRFGRGGEGDRGGSREGAQGELAGGRQQRVIATADDRTNTLVVSAPSDLLKVIDGIVQGLDSDPTEEQSVFIYPLKNSQAKNLETVLNQIFSETTTTGTRTGGTRTTSSRTGGVSSSFGRGSSSNPAGVAAGDLAGQVYVVADEATNSLLVRTASKYVDRVKGILLELDRPVPQVLIKVLIVEVTYDDALDLGTEFSILNLGADVSAEFNVDVGGGTNPGSGGLVTATIDTGLSAVFNALQRKGRLDVLSRPYILASDNKEATITVGQEVPFIRSSRTTETGQTIANIEWQDIGIILRVTPHVNPDGLVIMDVIPEISSLSETTIAISETVNWTVYNKRSAETQVAVPNGQTIVIGGLMEDRISKSVRKVPVLGDVPLLNLLFRRTIESKVKTELLIFLTPRVAERPEHLQAISMDETVGLKAVRSAGGPGAFEEHMKAMQVGATTLPSGDKDEVQPQP